MSSTPRNAMGSRQTVSSELTPREFHPSDGLPEPPSLPATVLSRSDCDWTGVPLFSLWVMAKSGAARYFESVKTGSPPFIARCHLAGHGVPLHTLMLITITKRKYLANEYSVVKEQSPFSPHKGKLDEKILSSHPVADGKPSNSPLFQTFFNFSLSLSIRLYTDFSVMPSCKAISR